MRKTINRNPKLSIFNFSNYRDFLLASCMPDGLYSHSSNSLDRWAHRLGYKSGTTLTMVLKGTRFPSQQLVNAFCDDLKLNDKEKKYFELLVQHEKFASKNKDTSDIESQISLITKNKSSNSVSIQEFSSISDWYHLVIKQMITTKGFIEDYDWISRKLRRKITPLQAKRALNNLLDIGVIERDAKGQLVLVNRGMITSNDIPSVAIQKHHMGMLEMAMNAVVEQPVEHRQVNSITLKINDEKVSEAKEFIFEFLKEFNNRFSTKDSNRVYQMNLQMFEHTKEIDN